MAEPTVASAAVLAGFISDPDLRKLFDYWRGKRQGRPMPSKDDIDPVEIPWALNRIFLMDYDPKDSFRYRLAGSEISGVFGRSNLKGLTFSDILPPKGAQVVKERWTPLTERPAALSMKGLVYLAAERAPVGERLLLPLADTAGGPVTGVLGMTVCKWVTGLMPGEVKQSPLQVLPVSEIP